MASFYVFIFRSLLLLITFLQKGYAEFIDPEKYIEGLGSVTISTMQIGGITAFKYSDKGQLKYIYQTESGDIFSDDILLRPKMTKQPLPSSFITEGSGDKILYVFTSPYCEACKALWYSLRPSLEEYKVFWLPIHTDEQGNLIYEKIIDSSNPEKSLENYVEYSFIPKSPSRNRITPFQENLLKMQSLNLTGTPSGVIVNGNEKVTFLGIKDLRSKGVIN
jgi:protein-disulfide isomerase